MSKNYYIDNCLAEKVLFVGIDYRTPKGGIGSVLHTYSTFIFPFKFIRTSGTDLNIWQKCGYALEGYALILVKLLIDRKIKIVHIHSASGTSFFRKIPIILMAKFLKKHIVFHCHGGGFRDFRLKHVKLVDSILAYCDYIVALSEIWKEYFETISKTHVVTIKNVIDAPQEVAHALDNKVHFLFLGKICDNKGVFDIINSIETNRHYLKDRMIFHIGGNGEVKRLMEIIQAKGLEDIIRYEGWVDFDKKVKLLNICDVFILPSYIEGVPISILEAMSYRKPIITTHVGGIPSIVKAQVNGIIVEPGNKKDIYQAIRALINNKDLRLSLGEAGRKISLNYLPKNIAKQLNSLYTEILEKDI